jgi:ankyrin repeat protein
MKLTINLYNINMLYKLKYFKYTNKLKQLGGLNYSGPDDKVLVLLQRCAQNGFIKEVQPFLNLTRSVRNNSELWITIKNKDDYLKYATYTKNIVRLEFLMKKCKFAISRNLKLMFSINICSQNGFSNELKPIINLNKSYRNDILLWRTLNIEIINKLLEYAIRQRNLNRMRFLLKLGANPNGQLEEYIFHNYDDGEILIFPYLLALINQRSILYQYNPNIEQLDTPVEELIECLLEYGADPNILDTNGISIGGSAKSALFSAVFFNQPRIIELLIQYGADMNYIIIDKSLLMFAIRKNFFEIVELLIIHRANLDYINPSTGESAILMLLNNNQTYLVELMIQKGANINYRNPITNKTFLMFLVEYEELGLIKLILDKGARINDIDNHNKNALYYAQHVVNTPNREIIQLLLSRGAKNIK